MNERTRDKESATRRALALRKLGKVFGANGGDGGHASHTAEKQILTEILRSTREACVIGLVRDRLAVLSARDETDASDDEFDVELGEPGAGRTRRNPKPANDPTDLKTTFSKQWTSSALRSVAKGARPVPKALASGKFWEELLHNEAPALNHLTANGWNEPRNHPVVTCTDESSTTFSTGCTADESVAPGSKNCDAKNSDASNTKTRSASRRANRRLWSNLPPGDLRRKIKTHGYAVLQRPEAFETNSEVLAEDCWTTALSGYEINDESKTEKNENEEVEKKETTLHDVAAAADGFAKSGWPAVSVFVLDATWLIIDQLFHVAAEALGISVEHVLLEPTCFAWALESEASASEKSAAHLERQRRAAITRHELDHASRSAAMRDAVFFDPERKKQQQNGRKTVTRIGQNFSTPHRNYGAEEAWSNDVYERHCTDNDLGTLNLVCAWLPLTDATLDSGCLYVVPRESDPLWDDHEHPDHLKPARVEADGGTSLRFPIAAARALPCEAGSVCLWAGNTIYWGGACHLSGDDLKKFQGEDPATEGVVKIRHLMGLDDKSTGPKLVTPRRSIACTFRDKNKVEKDETTTGNGNECTRDEKTDSTTSEIHRGGALPYMSQKECLVLSMADRVRLIAHALVLNSRWFDMPSYLPGLHDEHGFGLGKDSVQRKEHTTKGSFASK